MRTLAMTAATLAAALSAAVLAATGSAAGAPAAASGPPFTACPAVGASASCGVLIVLNADGSTSLSVDPGSSNPFDGSDGTTIGVLNSSGRTIPSVVLASNLGLFGFDAGGMCSGTFPPPTPGGLTNGSTAFWSLESPPTRASFLLPKATPTLSGHATPGTAGGTLSDQATLAGGASATGSILFSLYAN